MDGRQLQQIHQALLNAFPAEAELTRVVRFGLNKRLPEIAQGTNYQDTVFQLIEWAEAQHKLNDLLATALLACPDNLYLQNVSNATQLPATTVSRIASLQAEQTLQIQRFRLGCSLSIVSSILLILVLFGVTGYQQVQSASATVAAQATQVRITQATVVAQVTAISASATVVAAASFTPHATPTPYATYTPFLTGVEKVPIEISVTTNYQSLLSGDSLEEAQLRQQLRSAFAQYRGSRRAGLVFTAVNVSSGSDSSRQQGLAVADRINSILVAELPDVFQDAAVERFFNIDASKEGTVEIRVYLLLGPP